jgi:DNA-binding transcriptional LysR family regulator
MNPLINLLHLKFFCDAVTLKSVSQAAKINFVTQSAVSQGILKLERIIGADLIFHTRQGLQLTEDGKIVFENATHIFRAVQQTFDLVNRSRRSIQTDVKFVCTKSLGLAYIPAAYQRITQNIPQLNIHFKMGGLEFVRDSLMREEAEFAIAVVDHSFDDFEKVSLHKGCFHLYHAKHTSEDLLDKGILVDYSSSLYVNEVCAKLKLPILMELSGWEDVARFTEIGLGVGFLPDFIVNGSRFTSLSMHYKSIPLYEYEIFLLHKKGKTLSRGASAFLDQLTSD